MHELLMLAQYVQFIHHPSHASPVPMLLAPVSALCYNGSGVAKWSDPRAMPAGAKIQACRVESSITGAVSEAKRLLLLHGLPGGLQV